MRTGRRPPFLSGKGPVRLSTVCLVGRLGDGLRDAGRPLRAVRAGSAEAIRQVALSRRRMVACVRRREGRGCRTDTSLIRSCPVCHGGRPPPSRRSVYPAGLDAPALAMWAMSLTPCSMPFPQASRARTPATLGKDRDRAHLPEPAGLTRSGADDDAAFSCSLAAIRFAGSCPPIWATCVMPLALSMICPFRRGPRLFRRRRDVALSCFLAETTASSASRVAAPTTGRPYLRPRCTECLAGVVTRILPQARTRLRLHPCRIVGR